MFLLFLHRIQDNRQMKHFQLLTNLLLMILLYGCDWQPLPSSMSNTLGEIHSRGIITDTSLEKGSTALFSASGGNSFVNQIFTFDGSNWTNENVTLATNTPQATSLTALYPAYNDSHTLIPENPYTEGALEDVLIAQATFTDQTNIDLSFTHLFSMLTIHVQSPFKESLTSVSLKAPKVTGINATERMFTTTGEHTTHLDKSDSGDYTFIIPSIEHCNLTLTFTFDDEEEVSHPLTHTFEGGHKYECNVTGADTRPGIRTIDDLIDFSLLINGNLPIERWSDFGYKEGADTIYCLLNDITITEKDFTLSPIGCNKQAPFAAIFDGKGHTITGFKISASNSTAGLFGRITPSGVVKNLHLNDCSSPTIETSASSGIGLLASTCYGIITNCSVSNSQVTTIATSPTGGLVGDLRKGGKVINCFVQKTEVTSAGFIGSIAGSMKEANITNCYVASNTIKRTGSYSGGIVGSATNSDITNCYTYDITLSSSDKRGQIVGSAQNTTIYHYFYDKISPALINNNINESNITTFYKRYDTETFKTINGNEDVFQLLYQWVKEQGENSIYTFWTDNKNLPAVFIK